MARQPPDRARGDRREQAPLRAHGARRGDRRGRGRDPRRCRHRVVQGRRRPDQQTRHQHAHGLLAPGASAAGARRRARSHAPRALTIASVKALEDSDNAPDIASVSPVASTSVTATFDGATTTATVDGSTPSYLAAENYTVQAGRAITDNDVTSHARVIDIGQTVASELFTSGQNPIGQTVKLGGANFTVVGLLDSKGSTGLQDADAVAIAPYTAVQDVLTGYSQSFSQLIVQGRSASTLNLAQAEVESILASANDTTVADLPFRVLNQQSLLTAATSTSKTFTVLLAAVAAISLLVGGIGVMNIMLVTVTERTREIGIRKAIGAPKSAILTQFLLEAVLLSLIGGVAGIVAGLAGSRFRINGVQPVIAPYSIVLSFVIAIAVGVFFGFYPANRAASLRPIDALRYE